MAMKPSDGMHQNRTRKYVETIRQRNEYIDEMPTVYLYI